jgi:hypothetical protein
MPQLTFSGGFNGRDTLADARARMVVERKQPGGTICPCCNKHVQEYRRPIHSSMGRALIALYHYERRHGEGSWAPLGKTASRNHSGGDYSKCAWWGLVEQRPKTTKESKSKKDSGVWRLTDDGRAFVRNQTRLLSHAREYLSDVIGLEGAPVCIEDVLGDHFNYPELMRGDA